MGAGASTTARDKMMRSVGIEDGAERRHLPRVRLFSSPRATASSPHGSRENRPDQPAAFFGDDDDDVGSLTHIDSLRNRIAARDPFAVASNDLVAYSRRAPGPGTDETIHIDQEDAPTEFQRYLQSYDAELSSRGAGTQTPPYSYLRTLGGTEGGGAIASSSHSRTAANSHQQNGQSLVAPSQASWAQGYDLSACRFLQSVETAAAVAPSFSFGDATALPDSVKARRDMSEKMSVPAKKTETDKSVVNVSGLGAGSEVVKKDEVTLVVQRSGASTRTHERMSPLPRVTSSADYDYGDEPLRPTDEAGLTATTTQGHLTANTTSGEIPSFTFSPAVSQSSHRREEGLSESPLRRYSAPSASPWEDTRTALTDVALRRLGAGETAHHTLDVARAHEDRRATYPTDGNAVPVLDLTLPRRVRRSVNSSTGTGDPATLRESDTFSDADTLIAHNKDGKPSSIVLPNPSVAKARHTSNGKKYVPNITAFEYS